MYIHVICLNVGEMASISKAAKIVKIMDTSMVLTSMRVDGKYRMKTYFKVEIQYEHKKLTVKKHIQMLQERKKKKRKFPTTSRYFSSCKKNDTFMQINS